MPEIRWLPEALVDIGRLHKFLFDNNPDAAGRAVSAIIDGVKLLKESSKIGRPMSDETGRRELFIAFGNSAYVLRYIVQDKDIVVVVRVWHGRENR